MPPRGNDTDVEETTSCDIYEIISEIKGLQLEIKKCDAKIDLLPNLDLPNSDYFGPPLPPDYEKNNLVQYIEEPSSNTCEQRGYGRFKCECGRSWGSSFSYLGYAQTCFTCGEDVQPREITQISYDKKQTKRRFKPEWRRFSHSYQFCEACKLNQCAWRPEEFRTNIRTFTNVTPVGGKKLEPKSSRRKG
ncbi:Oidioi.mRNA.OKI2018_I69.PAR.g9603.t1.cds [Oikopleura dioica]|uniref:Oidioi.mRNA.OKI2018_I69.PAR.g9603.t1.cds n=1 Tax=Oikopleura dioica TaxID=34765 RepID=A0ABN7RU25_OIKDI|nr:Oidioi.mRNA.OKI2018_I69.PAR.g9603.t1.cds [Oikopleura dioica]